MTLCPHCQTDRPKQGYHHHVTACAKRRTKEQLQELWDKHGELRPITKELKVGRRTVTQWLDEHGIRGDQRATGGWRKEKYVVYPELVRAKSAKSCGVNHKKKCYLWRTCLELVARGQMVKCEAPDKTDIELDHFQKFAY